MTYFYKLYRVFSHNKKKFFLGGICLFLLICLLSYDVKDFRDNHFPTNSQIKNLFGQLGANIAHQLFFWIGISIFLPIIGGFLFIAISLNPNIDKKLWPFGLIPIYIATITAITLWLAIVISFYEGNAPRSLPSNGGMLGATIAGLLKTHFGKTAESLLVIISLSIII